MLYYLPEPYRATITSADWLAIAPSKRPSTVEIWRGDGLDGGPIAAVLSGLRTPSINPKTGQMLQVTIWRRDMSPQEAVDVGADRSVCGDCKFRWSTARAIKAATGKTVTKCYVVPWKLTVSWRSWAKGNVPIMSPAEAGKLVEYLDAKLRQGAYGDPAAIPLEVWRAVDLVGGTSYSHQWRNNPKMAEFAMASANNVAEAIEARAAGWRTYRVDSERLGPQPGEIACPNTADKSVTCLDCGLCSGNRSGAKSIMIEVI